MIPYLLIIVFSFLITFVLKGLIDKFLEEEDMYQAYLEEHKEELENKLSKEEKNMHKQAIKKLKAPFAPKFSIIIFITTCILECLLFAFIKNGSLFLPYAFLVLILEISLITDIKKNIIPNETNYFGAVVGFIYAMYMIFIFKDFDIMLGMDYIFGGLVAFLIFFLIGVIAYLILKKEGMGGGDTKLVLVIGLFMGARNFIQIFVLSFFIASVVSIFLLITKKKTKNDYIPFGPSLCIATYITMLIPVSYSLSLWYNLLIK